MKQDDARAWRANDDVAVPAARPMLPATDALVPYLREIDRNRRYANHGPLVRRFEARLAERLGAPQHDAVALLPSGTAALAATLAGLGLPAGSRCIVPAWTFAATAHAVVQAGLVPWFVDVDPASGMLRPATVRACRETAPGTLGAVVVVAPFGAPVDVAAWITLRAETGLEVVIDAAAGFDTVRASELPTVVSLHATKVFGIGEGGFVTCTDAARIGEIRQRGNFGFAGSREATLAGGNGKASEYAAAVGLAALDEWPRARADFVRVARRYRNAFSAAPGIALQAGYGERWISSTTVVTLPDGTLEVVEDALAAAGIGSRRWWGAGLGEHAAFARYPSECLDATRSLARRTLGLPCWRDLPDETIDRIAATLRAEDTSTPRRLNVPAR
jgi:dTDP-4-amino-4,6-dideoxygalactose transaminase